jgi:hypothetical protein
MASLGQLRTDPSGEEPNSSGDDAGEHRNDSKSLKDTISEHAAIALQEHISKKQTIALFKARMTTLICELEKVENVQLPILVFIDELDRCRPTYAIELLEAIKHLFGVDGVYFVVATNLEQLGHSIKSVYGEQFDSERYLKRFFDQEYLLPDPNTGKFVTFLHERLGLDSLRRSYVPVDSSLIDPLTPSQYMLVAVGKAFDLSLRDLEQVSASLQAILMNWPENERVHLTYLMFLLCVKQRSSTEFQRLAEMAPYAEKGFRYFIAPLIKPGSTVKSRTIDSSSGRFVVSDVPIISLFEEYYVLVFLDVTEMMNRSHDSGSHQGMIVSAVTADTPNSWSGSPPKSPLFLYHSRVSQAGQLRL